MSAPPNPGAGGGNDRDGSDDGHWSPASNATPSSPVHEVERHEILGPCPQGHSASVDCHCDCPRCLEDPEGDIPRVIRERIQAGNYFHREADRFDHGETPAPHHNEGPEVPLPLRAPRNTGMIRFPRTRADGGQELVEIPLIAFDLIQGYVSGIELLEGSSAPSSPYYDSDDSINDAVGLSNNQKIHRKFPRNPEDHHNLTLAMGQRPCTEWIPWLRPTLSWKLACPNDRRKLSKSLARSYPCNEPNCGEEEPGEIIIQYDHEGVPLSPDRVDFEDDYEGENDENPPAAPGTHNSNRWVCEDHRKDAARYWQEDSLLKAHLIPTCIECREYYSQRYPYGLNTCTCRNLLQRWQCRRCYEKKVRQLQTHFRTRIGVRYTGGVDLEELGILPDENEEEFGFGLTGYHKDGNWRDIRRRVAEQHPCTNPGHSRQCGGRRAAANTRRGLGRNVLAVMHCRCCGGVVVAAERAAPVATRARRRADAVTAGPEAETRRERRGRGMRGASPLLELTFVRGKPIARNQ